VKIGIDIGGVIVGGNARTPGQKREDTMFSPYPNTYLKTQPTEGAIAAVTQIVKWFGPENVFIVSKASPDMERRTRHWMEHNKFYEQTGFLKENLNFCLERIDKAPICKRLGINIFIDDKLDVLRHFILDDLVRYRIWFKPKPFELEKLAEFVPKVIQVRSWEETLKAIEGIRL